MKEKELRILLADDDADDRVLFQEALEGVTVRYELTMVHNGEQLMTLLTKDTQYDILFLDLNMPRKNGFDCLLEIRQNKNLDGLAVIAISTSFIQETVNMLYKNGAQYFIHKPNEFSQLKHLIQNGITIVGETHIAKPVKEGITLSAEG